MVGPSGFSLLEVLISILVLMVAFLALAGLHGISVANNHSAYLRSQATIQAHDMADRMYANWAAVSAGAYNSVSGIPGSPPTCITSATSGGALDSVNCTIAQMATWDAFEWNTANAELLPSGQGTVTGPDGSGVYTITVSWLEVEAKASATKTFTFQLKPLP